MIIDLLTELGFRALEEKFVRVYENGMDITVTLNDDNSFNIEGFNASGVESSVNYYIDENNFLKTFFKVKEELKIDLQEKAFKLGAVAMPTHAIGVIANDLVSPMGCSYSENIYVIDGLYRFIFSEIELSALKDNVGCFQGMNYFKRQTR